MYEEALELAFGSGRHGVTRIFTHPYCECEFPDRNVLVNHKGNLADIFDCRCGESVTKAMEWTWQEPQFGTDIDRVSMLPLRISGTDVTFHPVYSQGTALVRGNRPLEAGRVHFWELRCLTSLSGTDVMFGVGTDKIDLNGYNYAFASVLGMNEESWGISYTGNAQHNGKSKQVSNSFSKGVLLGICVNRINGTLEFQVNRRSIGVVYHNIPVDRETVLYPMISCTSAKTIVRLLNATSEANSLAMKSFKALAARRTEMRELLSMAGLRHLKERFWFLAPTYFINSDRNRCIVNELWDLCDQNMIDGNFWKNKKQKFEHDDAAEEAAYQEDPNDLYKLPDMSGLWRSKEKKNSQQTKKVWSELDKTL